MLSQSHTLTNLLSGWKSADAVYGFALNLLGKRLVEKAVNEVKSGSQYPALYMAALVVRISSKHPNFFKALLGNMVQACPYVVPCVHKRRKGEDEETFKKKNGHVLTPEGTFELEEKYTERMSSIIGLYAAIIAMPSQCMSFVLFVLLFCCFCFLFLYPDQMSSLTVSSSTSAPHRTWMGLVGTNLKHASALCVTRPDHHVSEVSGTLPSLTLWQTV